MKSGLLDIEKNTNDAISCVLPEERYLVCVVDNTYSCLEALMQNEITYQTNLNAITLRYSGSRWERSYQRCTNAQCLTSGKPAMN